MNQAALQALAEKQVGGSIHNMVIGVQSEDGRVDTTKTVGIIKLPGAMTGMILAGASPLEAVRLQMIVMYMLVGANTFAGLTAAVLTYREFFTGAHQLIVPLAEQS